jgi:hypothetical protein
VVWWWLFSTCITVGDVVLLLLLLLLLEVDECVASTSQSTATNLSNRLWEFHAASWTTTSMRNYELL